MAFLDETHQSMKLETYEPSADCELTAMNGMNMVALKVRDQALPRVLPCGEYDNITETTVTSLKINSARNKTGMPSQVQVMSDNQASMLGRHVEAHYFGWADNKVEDDYSEEGRLPGGA
ncbi:uncharacterized protein KY384_000873 [Bacidia gigantensis]|uniref:uncharacterized protein n=1 Tax=Bacidia gigantensis TaxID=2732470 RepID=UPI001D0553F4|nr:uncharacterized protein KY384_000873 [Bacidia gigantensis]KAG8534030.1 hypothetical protein KY384_000873 [Bacidia gigantensis]